MNKDTIANKIATYKDYQDSAIKFVKKSKWLFVILGIVFVYLFYAIFISGPSKKAINNSNIQKGTSVRSNVRSEISPNYRRNLEEQAKLDEERAKAKNTSYLPPAIGLAEKKPEKTAPDSVDANFSNEGEAKPVAAPQLTIDSSPASNAPAMTLPENSQATHRKKQVVVVHRDYIAQSRYDMLKAQMAAAANADEAHKQVMGGSVVDGLQEAASSPLPTSMNAGMSASINTAKEDVPSFSMPVDGTSWRGHFIRTMDSREPMRVFGQIDSGPYRGSMVLGSFAQNGISHKIMIRFNEIVYKYEAEDGSVKSGTSPISAIAIDPSTDSSGFADYVNRHIFQKILIPLATSFATGVGQAISQSGSSSMMSASGGSVISQGVKNTRQQMLQAMGVSGSQMASVLQQMYGNQPDTIKVFAGHPFLMVFDGSSAGGGK